MSMNMNRRRRGPPRSHHDRKRYKWGNPDKEKAIDEKDNVEKYDGYVYVCMYVCM